MEHSSHAASGSPYLQFDGVSKLFPGVRALDSVTFAAREGSVHALMGENGAGKSTLLKILSGAYRPDAGTLRIGGEAVAFSSTQAALQRGVAVIYQELQLVSELSVAENLYLGEIASQGVLIHRRDINERARQVLTQLGETIDPRVPVGSLPIAQRQMVEIAKALTRNAKIIAFDEPTSSLSKREVEKLEVTIRRLRDEGRVILYVSHRMEEIFRNCDAATVLRDGKHVVTFDSLASVTQDQLVSKMVGRSIEDVFGYQPRPQGEVALKVEGLAGPGVVEPVSFEARAGEVVGIFGLVGAGRTELLKLIYHAARPRTGQVHVNGRLASYRDPLGALRHGIAFAPEDRKKEGIVPTASVQENINLGTRRHFSPLGMLVARGKERANAAGFVKSLAVKTPTLEQQIVNLSGGNQQKAILGRVLGENPKVLLLDEPTRGIDIGSKQEIYRLIFKLASQGVCVIVVSSEMPEVLGLADRILVMREGRLVGELPRGEATQERVLKLALPVTTAGATA